MAVGCGVLFDRNGTGGWGNSSDWWSVLTHHGPGFFGRDISNIRAGRIRGGQNGKKRDVLIERVAGSVDDVLGNEDRLAGIDPAFRVSTVGLSGRGDWIRTSDLFVPNEARYRAAPLPEHVQRLYLCRYKFRLKKMAVRKPNRFTLDESCLSNRFDDPVGSFASHNPSCVLHRELSRIKF